MTDAKPKLEVLRRRSPGELASCEGYLWHLKTRIGKGSFGEVYLGWNTVGQRERGREGGGGDSGRDGVLLSSLHAEWHNGGGCEGGQEGVL